MDNKNFQSQFETMDRVHIILVYYKIFYIFLVGLLVDRLGHLNKCSDSYFGLG